MKKYIIVLLMFGLLIACSNDDDVKPLIVTTSDLTTTIPTNSAQNGDVIGQVPGTSNQGSVQFSLISQTPNGVFAIEEGNGEIIVADATALDITINQQIVLEVQVSKDDVIRTSMVVVDILVGCLSQFDPVSGDWTLELMDTFGDGWDGASISANIDGTVTEYTLEPGMPIQSFVINVPEGTGRWFFTYEPGDFEEEHLFSILNPNGDIEFADGPNPTPGEVCFDGFEPSEPVEEIPCNNTNFVNSGPPGDWTLDLIDLAEDGWDGAFMSVVIDGTATDYTITPGLPIESFTINVPDGAQSLLFVYTAGSFEEEHIFGILDPDGNEVTFGGPNIPPGEVCADSDETPPPPPASCNNTNFVNSGPPGDWTLDLIDLAEDGWDGAFMSVVIDGTATDYAITPGLPIESFTINVPDGTQSLLFVYTPGSFEEEHIFGILDPDGNEVTFGGPNIPPGEVCAD